MKRLLTVLLISLSAFTLSAQDIYPKAGEDWARVRPSKYGFDNQKIKDLRNYIIDSMATTGMMIIVGGESIFQYGNIESVSYIASCRKSVLAMLYGKYVKNGTIKLNATLGELGITDHGGLLPIARESIMSRLIRVVHLMILIVFLSVVQSAPESIFSIIIGILMRRVPCLRD